jgi:uncharacterized protein YegL
MSRRKKAPKKSHIGIVLDCSGSMITIALETEQGFNQMIEKLREGANDTTVTLVEFDSTVQPVYEQKPLPEVPKMVFKTRGMTALLDGVGVAIRRMEKFVKPGDNVAITIMTDGGENSSQEFTKEAVTKLMDEKREEGWEFNFLGAGPASWQGAQLLNIGDSHTINYSGAAQDHAVAFNALALSNVAKTQGGSSSYLRSAPELKSRLEADAGTSDIQINVRQPRRVTRKR